MSDRAKRTGVYLQNPEDMLTHAISVTLGLSVLLAASSRGDFVAVCSDPKLNERAARLILSHMLRAMHPNPTEDFEALVREDFERLVREVSSLAKES